MGRKPTPTNLKILQGNSANSTLNEPSPPQVVDIPPPPDHFTELEIKTWNRVLKLLIDMKVVTEADLLVVARYCELSARRQEITEQLAIEGLVFEQQNKNGSTYRTKNPLCILEKELNASDD